MRQLESHTKPQEFEPLFPIDVIRPPQQRDFDESSMSPQIDQEEVMRTEIEQLRENKNNPTIPYKGDKNAPVDAEHPLSKPPESPEQN